MKQVSAGILVWTLVCGLAQNVAPGVVRAETVGPYFHQESGSYFELVDLADSYAGRFNKDVTSWENIRAVAKERVRKGRRGRLAIVDTRSKHEFLKQEFRLEEPAWIGLRYFCKYKKLMWVNGDMFDRKGFSAWAPRWNVKGGRRSNTIRVTACNNYLNHYPVHYWPEDQGFLWNANGTKKHFNLFFVEYPPENDVGGNS